MDSEWIIHAAVLVGVSVVAPLATRRSAWGIAAATAVVSLLLPRGPAAAAWAACWPVVGAVGVLRAWPPRLVRSVIERLPALAFSAYATVAGVAFVASRAGWQLFGIGEPIVELTSVHFLFAGTGALVLAMEVRARHRIGGLAVLLTMTAPPVVAAGFVLGHPVPQVGGAVLMSAGVLVTAALQLRDAGRALGRQRVLLGVSALAPWVPMVLAVGWAASLHWDVPALSIPDMARTHGALNAVFVVTGLLGRRSGRLDQLLRRADASELTYDHIGSTLRAGDRNGRSVREVTLAIGDGPLVFDAAVGALNAWACHEGLGATVHPPDAAIAEGTTVLVVVPLGPASVVVANRIVAVVDEPDRFGFAYGTLRGHPERGEEAFLVERIDDGTVRAVVRVDAVPAALGARIAAPVVAALQRRAVRRYLRGLATAVEDAVR